MNKPEASVLVERDGPVATVRLNRPERLNAWGQDLRAELVLALADLAGEPDIRSCVLTGSGRKAFCAGADLKEAAAHGGGSIADQVLAVSSDGHRVFESVLTFPKPLICAVNGYAIGAGFILATCCDIILAAENASFSLPQVRQGQFPAYGALARLAQWIGRGRAMELGLTGRSMTAEEARSVGLATRVCPLDDLVPEAAALAGELTTFAPLAVKLTKESLAAAPDAALQRAAGIGDLYRSIALAAARPHPSPTGTGTDDERP